MKDDEQIIQVFISHVKIVEKFEFEISQRMKLQCNVISYELPQRIIPKFFAHNSRTVSTVKAHSGRMRF